VQRVVVLGEQTFFPRIAIGSALADRLVAFGELVALDAGQEFSPAPDVEDALTQQRPHRSFGAGVDVGGRDQIGPQQVGQFLAVDAVVLVLAAVDSFHIQRVSEDEGQAGFLTGIGEPVPIERALAADGQGMAVRFDEFEEVIEVVTVDVGMDQFVSLAVHQADVHLSGMQIDSAVELCGGCVILHRSSSSHGADHTG